MTSTVEDCLAQLVKNCLLPKQATIKKTCQDALDLLQDEIVASAAEPHQLRERCLTALQLALESKNNRLETIAINGMQVLLMDKRFESCLESEKEEHWLPTQMLRAVVVMPTLSDDQQVDIMKMLLNMTFSSSWCVNARVITKMAEHCIDTFQRTSAYSHNHLLVIFVRILDRFLQRSCDESSKMVLETSNVCNAGSVHVAAKATLTQLLTAVAEKLHYKPNTMLDSADCLLTEFTGSGVPTDPDSLTSDVVTILAYLCDKLNVTLSSSSSNKHIVPLLLEGIYAILKNVPVTIRDNHNFVDLIWQQLCPSLICILGNPLTDKSITSQKAVLQDEVGRGSGCSSTCPQLGATAKTIYTISVELVRLVGAVQSLRPVLESLFHRMLLYPPASHRLDALKTLTELFNSADRVIDLAGPVIIDTDCSSSARKKAHSNLALLKLIIDSLEECSHCSDSAISVATVVLVCDLLTTVEHLVNGDSVEKIEEIHRINKIIEDIDTAPGTTLSSPPGWYASSSDNDSDTDMKHDIPVRVLVTSACDTRDSPMCTVPASQPLKTDFDLMERQSASAYIHQLLIFLPSLLDCISQSDVDQMMQKFASDVCTALMTESQASSVPLNADGVYLATYSALSLNLKLHLQGYYNSEEKSVPITEMQFIDEILGTGLLLYLSRSWLSEVFHHIISSDLLALAGYTAAMTGHSDSPLIHSLIDLDGLQSREVAGQMLSVYHDTSVMRNSDSGTPALKIGPSFSKEILTVCWEGILDVLSSVLTERSSGDLSSSLSLMLNAREETEKARQAICLSLEGLQKAARLTSILGLQDRCGAVFARLASTSCVSEDSRERSDKKRQGLSSVLVSKPCPVRLPAAYALSMDVLLDIGLEMGSHSADCWTHVFKCCAHVASVEHTYFSGQSQTPRAAPEPQSHGLDGASVSELGLYGTVVISPQPVTPIMGVPELIRQSHIDSGWDSSIVAGGVLTPAVTSKVLCRLSQQVDRLFEDAANKLTMKTLISFLAQLCVSSHHQLASYHQHSTTEGSTSLPTNALHLYRLGDILLKCAHSSRPLLHLMRAWCEVAPHFVEAACHHDRTISKKAVDCMHEVSTALLSGWGEPPHWRFNEALCKPFENLLCLDICDGDIQDQVICSIGELVEACSTEMHSGWRSLFGALRAVKIEYTVNEEVNEARQHHIANVLDVFDVFLNTDNVAVFSNAAVDCILCLQKYVHGTGESDGDDNDDSDSGSDVTEVTAESLCLPALGYLQHCCNILASMWSMPSCPLISDADRIRTTANPYCVDPVIPNFDMSSFHAAFGVIPPETSPPGRAPHAPHSHRNGTANGDVIPESSDDGAELGYRATPLGQLDKPTGVLRVWFLVLEGLTNTVSACTRNYQPQILQTLFDLLRSAAEVPGAAFALYCVNHLLLPKLQQWLRHGNQINNYWHSGSLANFKQYCGLCTDLVVEFILQFTAVAEQEKAVDFMLSQLLDVLVECVAQCTESLSRLGCSCIRHCVLSCGPELTESMWFIAVSGVRSACRVSVHSLQQLMTPFLPGSDNFYGDIGHVKVAVRKDQGEAGCDRLCHLAHQVFLLESQQGERSPLDSALDENQSYVFLIYPPTEGDTRPDSRLTRVSFSSVVVGLISHQLLMQTVATLLLHGTSNTVSCERSVIAAVPPSGGQRVDSGATNGSDGVDLIQDVKLPGMLSWLSARCVDALLGCLWHSYCVTRDFDTRPGLKFLLQKVAHANTAANLYKLTAVSLTVYMHALLEICAHQDGLCIDNIKDMLASDPPPACPRAHIDAHVHTFVHMLKGGFDEICTTYVDLYLEHEGPSLADILSTQVLVFLQVAHDDVPTLKRDRSLRQRVADTFSKKSQPTCDSDIVQTVTVQEDNSDYTDESTAMIEPHGDPPGDSTEPTTHSKQRTGDRVYSVASTRTIQGLMTEYKKRKKTKSMPTFVRATRSSHVEHTGAMSSDSISPQIEQEHRKSVMKDSDAQLGAWVEMLCSLLQLLEQLADHQFVALLPATFDCVNQLVCHSRDPRLREALAKWTHHVAHIYGFAPHGASHSAPQGAPHSPPHGASLPTV